MAEEDGGSMLALVDRELAELGSAPPHPLGELLTNALVCVRLIGNCYAKETLTTVEVNALARLFSNSLCLLDTPNQRTSAVYRRVREQLQSCNGLREFDKLEYTQRAKLYSEAAWELVEGPVDQVAIEEIERGGLRPISISLCGASATVSCSSPSPSPSLAPSPPGSPGPPSSSAASSSSSSSATRNSPSSSSASSRNSHSPSSRSVGGGCSTPSSSPSSNSRKLGGGNASSSSPSRTPSKSPGPPPSPSLRQAGSSARYPGPPPETPLAPPSPSAIREREQREREQKEREKNTSMMNEDREETDTFHSPPVSPAKLAFAFTQISPALLQQDRSGSNRGRKTSENSQHRKMTNEGSVEKKRSSIVPVSLRTTPPETGETLALLFTLRSSVPSATDVETGLRSQIAQCEERREKLKQRLTQTPVESAPELHHLLVEAFNEQEAELHHARRKMRELLERNQQFATQEGQGLKKLFEAMRTAAPKNVHCNDLCARESEFELTKQGELNRLIVFIDKLKVACNEKCICHVSKGSRKCYSFFLASFFHCDGLECVEQYIRDDMFQKQVFLCIAVYLGHALLQAKNCMGGLVKLPKLKPGQYWRDRTLPLFSEHLKPWVPLQADHMDLLLRLVTDNLEKTGSSSTLGMYIVNPFLLPVMFQQVFLTSEAVRLPTLDMAVWLVNKKANAEIVSTQDDWWTWPYPILSSKTVSRESYVRGILFSSSVLIAGMNSRPIKEKEDLPLWLFLDFLKVEGWTEENAQLARDCMMAVMGTISTGAAEFSGLYDWEKTGWADSVLFLLDCMVDFLFFRPVDKDAVPKKPRASLIPKKGDSSENPSPRSGQPNLTVPDEDESVGPRRFSESGLGAVDVADGQIKQGQVRGFLAGVLGLHLNPETKSSKSPPSPGQSIAAYLAATQGEEEAIKFLDLGLIQKSLDMLKALRLDREVEEQVQCASGERKVKAKGSQEFKFLQALASLFDQIETPTFLSLGFKSSDGGKGIETILDELADLRHVKTSGLFRRKKLFEPDKITRKSKIDKPVTPIPKTNAAPATRSRSSSNTKDTLLTIDPPKLDLVPTERKALIELNSNGEYLGNLRKKSGGNRGTWQTRFFVLNSTALLYYSDEQTYRKKARQAQFKSLKSGTTSRDKKDGLMGKLKEADGARTIPLNSIKSISIPKGVKGVPDGTVLNLHLADSTSHGGLFELMAASPQECSEWHTAINGLLTPLPLPPPPPGSPERMGRSKSDSNLTPAQQRALSPPPPPVANSGSRSPRDSGTT